MLLRLQMLVCTIAGPREALDAGGVEMKLVEPRKVATDHLGQVLVLDKQGLWRLGSTGPPSKLLDGELCDFAIDLRGIVYAVGPECSVRKVDADGVVTDVFPKACENGSPCDCSIVVDLVAPYPDGTVLARCHSYGQTHFVLVTSEGKMRVRPKDDDFPECRSFPISDASCMDTDPDGTVFIADPTANCIRKITLDAAEVLAGSTASSIPHKDGPRQWACFNGPRGVAVNGDGDVLVADTSNHCIRLVSSLGIATTLCGRPGKRGAAVARARDALFAEPSAVAVDAHGHVLVADTGNGCIRRVHAHLQPPARLLAPAPPPTVGEDVGALLQSGLYADVTFVVGGDEVRGHRCILAARSPYFATLLGSHFQEATAPAIAVTDTTAAAFRALLRFLYTGHVDVEEEALMDLMGLAHRYQADPLYHACVRRCRGVLTLRNAVAWYVAADAGCLQEARKCILRYIANNLSRIVVEAPETMEELKAHPELLYEVTMAHSMKHG